MKFGIQSLVVQNLGSDFISIFDSWKEKIIREGLKSRIKKIIEKDLKELEGKK